MFFQVLNGFYSPKNITNTKIAVIISTRNSLHRYVIVFCVSENSCEGRRVWDYLSFNIEFLSISTDFSHNFDKISAKCKEFMGCKYIDYYASFGTACHNSFSVLGEIYASIYRKDSVNAITAPCIKN